MPGIVNTAVQQPVAQNAAPAGAPATKAGMPIEGKRLLVAAKKLLANKAVAKNLVEMMRSAEDPAAGLAQATISLMRSLLEQAGGMQFPPKVIVAVGAEVMSLIAAFGASAKLFKLTPDLIKQAIALAAQSLKGPAQGAAQPAAPAAQPAPAMAQPMMGA